MASTDPGPSPSPERPPRTHQRPSFTQVAASALAAVSAALISSTFGVAGTLIGTAIASVIASVGSTLYLASLRRTNDRLRRVAVVARRTDWSSALATRPSRQPAMPAPAPNPAPASASSRLRWSNLRAGLPVAAPPVGGGRRALRRHLRRGDRRAHRDPGVDQPAPHGLPCKLRLGAHAGARPSAQHQFEPGPDGHSLGAGHADQHSERERLGGRHPDGRPIQPRRGHPLGDADSVRRRDART